MLAVELQPDDSGSDSHAVSVGVQPPNPLVASASGRDSNATSRVTVRPFGFPFPSAHPAALPLATRVREPSTQRTESVAYFTLRSEVYGSDSEFDDEEEDLHVDESKKVEGGHEHDEDPEAQHSKPVRMRRSQETDPNAVATACKTASPAASEARVVSDEAADSFSCDINDSGTFERRTSARRSKRTLNQLLDNATFPLLSSSSPAGLTNGAPTATDAPVSLTSSVKDVKATTVVKDASAVAVVAHTDAGTAQAEMAADVDRVAVDGAALSSLSSSAAPTEASASFAASSTSTSTSASVVRVCDPRWVFDMPPTPYSSIMGMRSHET